MCVAQGRGAHSVARPPGHAWDYQVSLWQAQGHLLHQVACLLTPHKPTRQNARVNQDTREA